MQNDNGLRRAYDWIESFFPLKNLSGNRELIFLVALSNIIQHFVEDEIFRSSFKVDFILEETKSLEVYRYAGKTLLCGVLDRFVNGIRNKDIPMLVQLHRDIAILL